jgi:hypothetical protein
MTVLYRQMPLPGGGIVSINDLTRIYFGDFYLVKLEIKCEIPETESAMTSGAAKVFAGESSEYLTYKRYVQKMGVPSADVETVKLALVNDFETNSLPYILSAVFPAKLHAFKQMTLQKPVKTYMEKKL